MLRARRNRSRNGSLQDRRRSRKRRNAAGVQEAFLKWFLGGFVSFFKDVFLVFNVVLIAFSVSWWFCHDGGV